jgi:hypothetical protein
LARMGVDARAAPIPVDSPMMRAVPLESELLMFFSFLRDQDCSGRANHQL